jgi:hypothetical protein
MIGLIPIMLQIGYSIREYKKSQIDKYGSFLYEQQFPVYIKIFELIEKLNTDVQVVFIGLNNPAIAESQKELNFHPDTDFINTVSEFRILIKNNSLIVPNSILEHCVSFLKLNNVVRNTITRKIVGDENVLNKNLNNINETGG